ncbi:MAG: hypothetical protein RI885_1852 [Actinomycetota bacterium]
MAGVARTLVIALGVAAATGSSGYLVSTRVMRRRSAAVDRLAHDIPVHSAYWRDQARREGDLLYVAIGDSAAQGIGGSRPDRSYVGLVARDIRRLSGRTVRVVNLSQSGGRLREALAKQVPALKKLSPDVVTVSVGANDIATFDAERFDRELRALYDALPPHAIVAELPSFYFGAFERRVREANSLVKREAKKRGFRLARLHRVTVGRTAARTAFRDVAGDFFHPNDRGYVVWASAFAPLVAARVAELLQDRPVRA